jgi:MFS transporter, YNFM family, putative membrane transport protein
VGPFGRYPRVAFVKTGPALVGVLMCTMASAATLRAVDPLLPDLAERFGTLPGAVGIVITAYSIAYGGVQFVSGRIGDRWGKPQTIAAAALAAALATGACALATSLDMLIVLRAIAGACAGGIIPLGIAYIGDSVAYEQRQRALIRLSSMQILGTMAGQVGGGVVGAALGWQGVFVVLAAAFGLGAVVLASILRNAPARVPSTASANPGYGWVASPRARMVLATVVLEGFFFYGSLAFVAADLQTRFELDLATAGLVLLTFGAGGLVFAFTFARFFGAAPAGRVPLLGACALAISFAGMAAIPGAFYAGPLLALMGWGFFAMHSSLQTEATQMLPHARGHAVATFAAVFFTGQAVGVAVGGAAFDRFGAEPLFLASAAVLLAIGVRFARALARGYA